MGQELKEIFEKEWIENAKVSFDVGIRKFAVPLALALWVCDIFYMPLNYGWALVFRLISVPLSYFGLKFLHKSTTRSEILRRYIYQAIGYTVMVYGLIYLAHDKNNAYFLGLCVLAAGAFSFLSLPRSMFALLTGLIFLPFIPYAIMTGMVSEISGTFWVYLFCAGEFIVIFYYCNENLVRFQTKEFESRMALNQILKKRDDEIFSLVSELSVLRTRHAGFAQKEEAFRQARQLAHDIRSPLSALNLATQKVKASSSELAEFIAASSKRINDIADSILNKSRQELAHQSDFYVADIGKVIRTICEEKKLSASAKYPEKEINFEIELPGKPLRVRVFESDFSRAISNLVENSIEAILKRGSVKISCEPVLPGQIRIAVRDNGRGISREIIGNVGKYGFTFGKAQGNGLGLAFAFDVAKIAGGSVRVESEPDKFTCVEMTLPVLEIQA